MDRGVALMADIAHSVLDRLKNKSRTFGKDYQLLRTLRIGLSRATQPEGIFLYMHTPPS